MSATPSWSGQEHGWMAQALALAALGEGSASPNPRVGCVVVRAGRIVGRGFHRAAGLPHAEALALEEAGADARGSTLYVNLEPCGHHGRTAPCTDLLVERGVARVVAAMQDPNPLVDGKGFSRLRGAGIEVSVGLLAREARRLNGAFLHWHLHGRPSVTLKAALSLDGMLAAGGGASRWITAPPARRFAHRLRLGHDAVLVGAGTVRRDDPRLTVRLPGAGAARRRVLLSTELALDPRAAVLRPLEGGPPTRVYTSRRAAEAAVGRLGSHVEVVRVPEAPDGLALGPVLDDLGRLGVQSLLVEGGARVLASFLAAGLAQRGAFFISNKLLGGRGGTPLLDRPTVADPASGWRLSEREVLPLGDDLLVLGRLG